MVLLALLACRAEIAGNVVGAGGAPVAGARLVAEGDATDVCEAVTDADGRFRTRCAKGARTFTVTHPDHLPGTWKVEGDGRDVVAGNFTLVGIPGSAGAWLSDGVRFQALGGAQLHRVTTATLQAWCLPADAVPNVLGPGAQLLRNEPAAGAVPADAERWRLYRVAEPVVDASPTQVVAGSSGPVDPGAAGGAPAVTPTPGAVPPVANAAAVASSAAPEAVSTAASSAGTPTAAVPALASTPPAAGTPVATVPGRCVYRLRKGTAEHWEFTAERVPLDGEGAARLWTDLGSLPAGDYVLAPWVAGMFVREDVTADTWRGTWIRVPATP